MAVLNGNYCNYFHLLLNKKDKGGPFVTVLLHIDNLYSKKYLEDQDIFLFYHLYQQQVEPDLVLA